MALTTSPDDALSVLVRADGAYHEPLVPEQRRVIREIRRRPAEAFLPRGKLVPQHLAQPDDIHLILVHDRFSSNYKDWNNSDYPQEDA